MKQEEAFDLMKMGKNIFLTGAAGSGKTYLLNQYINYLKHHGVCVAVTASTGIAATHLFGTTIHSWSGIGVRRTLDVKDLERLLETKIIKRNYEKTKVLIIDEVSMLHRYQLDMVDIISRFILKSDKPFGNMQIILCGDFFQLPPVASDSAEKEFAFEADAWTNGDFYTCYLNEQHRQGNDPLLQVLNDIRSGTAGEHTKIPLRTRYKKDPVGAVKATKLYSHNINVDAINERELANIPGSEKLFAMTTYGPNNLVEGLKRTCLAPEHLKLKIGAEVMFVKNDPTGSYVNGTRCIVRDFDKNEGWPVVQTQDHRTITVLPAEWKHEENGIMRATITQIPLRLAWAITIHKSQGMTLDAAEIDLGNAFEPGMGYVALSRVRSLEGLKLMNLNAMALKVHPKILQQDTVFKNHSLNSLHYLQKFSEKEKIQHHKATLFERLGGIASRVEDETINIHSKSTIPTQKITLEMLKTKQSLESIAEQRGLTTGTILKHIEKLKRFNELDLSYIEHLKDTFAKEDFQILLSELRTSVDGKIKSIYEKFNGKYSYIDIQIVRLFLEN